MLPFKLTVRTYMQEDLPHLIRLYSHASNGHPQFSRNEDFLRHFMTYPGVHDDSVFVASIDDQITGLAILSITTGGVGLRQGSIIELQAEDASSIHALIQATLGYCTHNDVDVISVVPPPKYQTNKVFEGWLKAEMGVMMVKTLSPSLLLKVLLSNDETEGLCTGKKIVFHVGEEMVEVDNTTAKREEVVVEISMSPQTLLRIVFCRANPYVAYLTRRIRVRGVWNIFPMLKLLSMMRLPQPFQVSLADRK